MEKYLIDRRIDQMREEGISFKTSVEVGNNISMNDIKKIHDAVLICSGQGSKRFDYTRKRGKRDSLRNGFFAYAK